MAPWIFLALFYISATASALTDMEIQTRVEEALGARHPTQDAIWYRNLGSNAPPVLMRMYQGSTNTYHRIRLVEGLSAFSDDPSVANFLRQELKDNKQSAERRSLAESLYKHSKEKSLEDLQGLLSDEDPQMRKKVAHLFKKTPGEKAKRVYEHYRQQEKESWILADLDKTPRHFEPLKITGSTEDQKFHSWQGAWQGLLLKLNGKKSTAIPAILNVHAPVNETAGSAKITLQITQSKKPETWQAEDLKITPDLISGTGPAGTFGNGSANGSTLSDKKIKARFSLQANPENPTYLQLSSSGWIFFGSR